MVALHQQIMFNVQQTALQMIGNLAPDWLAERGINQFFSPKRRAFTAEESTFLATAQRASVVSAAGDTISYYIWGTGDKNIMLVHGWEENAASLRWYVQPLTELGYRVVALDAPRHGNSSGDETTFHSYGQAMHAVIHAIGSIEGIIAHSFGAPSTGALLENNPEIRPKKIVLIGAPNNLTEVLTRTAQQMRLPLKVRDAMYGVIEKRFNRPIGDFSMQRIFSQGDFALLVIHDREDKVVPFTDGENMAQATANSMLYVTEGLGHRRILKDNNVIEKIQKFFTA